MAIPNIKSDFDDTQKILLSFAKAQLSNIDTARIKKNSFQFFAITAFLYGAVQQLGKQSTLPVQLVNKYLCSVLCDAFRLPQYNGEGLVSSINRMMEEYYLLENIYREGEAAAERWLTHDEADCAELKTLLGNYQEFTMLDMSAAGMKSGSMKSNSPYTADTSGGKSSLAGRIMITLIVIGVLAGVAYIISGFNP
ncbi:MAG TPA: hypothetical protein VIM41_09920 [Gammaproteobacteria bacterium]